MNRRDPGQAPRSEPQVSAAARPVDDAAAGSGMMANATAFLGANVVQRKIARRLAQRSAPAPAPSTEVGAGQPLPPPLAAKFERSLGADLDGVRVHTDAASAAEARSVSAQAFTVGKDIRFGADRYDPTTEAGERLLAHEVAHTVQPANGPGHLQAKDETPGGPQSSDEHAADRAAEQMVRGQPAADAQGAGAEDTAKAVREVIAGTEGDAMVGSCSPQTEILATKIFMATGGKLRPDRINNDKHWVLKIGNTVIDPTAAQFVNYPAGTPAPILVGSDSEVRAQLAGLADKYGIRRESNKQPGVTFMPASVATSAALADYAYSGGTVRQYGDALTARPSRKKADYDTKKNDDIKAQRAAEDAARSAARPATAAPPTGAGVSTHPIIDVGGPAPAEGGGGVVAHPIVDVTAGQAASVDKRGVTAQPVSHADARAVAGELRPQLDKKLSEARAVYAPLAARKQALEDQLKTAPDSEKADLEARKKEFDKRVAAAERQIKELDADRKALDDPSSTEETFNRILAHQKSGVGVDPVTEIEDDADDLKKRGPQKQKSETTTSYKDGEALKQTHETATGVGLKGASHEQTDERQTDTADGRRIESEGRKVLVNQSGFHDEKTQKTEIEEDGKTRSTARKVETELGQKGASRSVTDTTSNADGSSTTTTRTGSLEREDGALTAKYSGASARKDADGRQDTTSTTGNLGITKKDDGAIGASAGLEQSRERKTEGGWKGGAVAGLDSGVTCNIVQDPKDPTKYRAVISIDLGAKLGVSGGYDKDADPGSSSVSGGLGASVSGHETYTSEKPLNEEEAKAYAEALKSGSGSDMEFRLIKELRANGREAAQRLYLGMIGKRVDPSKMKDGEVAEVDQTTHASLRADAGGKGGNGDSLGLDAGVDRQHDSKRRVEIQGDEVIYKPTEGDSTTVTGGATLGVGVAKGHMGLSHSDIRSSDYEFRIGVMDTALQKEYDACKTEKDFDDFARRHPETVNKTARTTGTADGGEGLIGVGSAEVGIKMSHGLTDREVRDKDGNLVENVYTGSNAGGASAGIGKYRIGESRTDTAVAHVGADGDASFDAMSEEKSTNASKWEAAHVPGMGDKDQPKKEKGVLDRATGAKPPEDTDDKDVTGIGINGQDLSYLGSLACKDPGKWAAAGAAQGGDVLQWEAAGKEIREGGGTKAATAKALAKYVGKGNSKEAILNIASGEGGGARSGARYEFPGDLARYKDSYDALVVANCEAQLPALEKQKAGDGIDKGNALLKQLDEMNDTFRVASGFSRPAVQAEMVSSITGRMEKVKAQLRVLKGGKAGEESPEEKLQTYYAKEGVCISYKDQETSLFDKIQATFKDGDCGDAVYDNNKLLMQIHAMYPDWEKTYDEMAGLGQEIGKDAYFRYQPDKARYQRALAGAPGPASELKPDAPDARKKPVVEASRDPVGDRNRQAVVDQRNQAKEIKAEAMSLKEQATSTGSRLAVLIKDHMNGQALEDHNAGMERLRQAETDASKYKDDVSAGLFEGMVAQDYREALAHFQKGLENYPGGR